MSDRAAVREEQRSFLLGGGAAQESEEDTRLAGESHVVLRALGTRRAVPLGSLLTAIAAAAAAAAAAATAAASTTAAAATTSTAATATAAAATAAAIVAGVGISARVVFGHHEVIHRVVAGLARELVARPLRVQVAVERGGVVEDLLHRLIAAEEPPDARCRAVRDALIPLDVVEEGGVELPLHLLRQRLGLGSGLGY